VRGGVPNVDVPKVTREAGNQMNTHFNANSVSIDRRDALALLVGAGVALKGGAPLAAQAQTTPRFSPAQVLNGADARVFPTEIKSELKRLAPNVYAFIQSQPEGWSSFNISNCGVVVGADSLVAIDAGAAPLMAKKLVADAQRATGKRFRRAVITHVHGDHTNGTQFLDVADVIAHEQCRMAMTKLSNQPKPANWAKRENWADGTEEFKLSIPNLSFSEKLTLHQGATDIELINLGPAHTAGDTLVYLPNEKILFAGDIGSFGVTPLHGSGYAAGVIKTCDKILEMDVVTIVPGHGPVGGKTELAEMRDYFILIQREGKKHYDAGVTAGRAAAEIDLGKYNTWVDVDRISTNMARMYSECSGTISPDQDFASFVKAREEYTALKRR